MRYPWKVARMPGVGQPLRVQKMKNATHCRAGIVHITIINNSYVYIYIYIRNIYIYIYLFNDYNVSICIPGKSWGCFNANGKTVSCPSFCGPWNESYCKGRLVKNNIIPHAWCLRCKFYQSFSTEYWTDNEPHCSKGEKQNSHSFSVVLK